MKTVKKPKEDLKKIQLPNREIKRPSFSFRYFSDSNLKDVRGDFMVEFLNRLKKLSELGWDQIYTSDKHGFGVEPIGQDLIKLELPEVVTKETTIQAFRASGDNRPFIGFRQKDGDVFYILYIESKFGDLYDHHNK